MMNTHAHPGRVCVGDCLILIMPTARMPEMEADEKNAEMLSASVHRYEYIYNRYRGNSALSSVHFVARIGERGSRGRGLDIYHL